MRILLPLFISLIINFQSIGQYTTILDHNFEQALIDLGIDSPPIDSRVLTATAAQVTDLIIPSKQITNLTGIEAFVNLRSLMVDYNELTTLNLSKNIHLRDVRCSNNNLKQLYVAKSTQLSHLNCSNNELYTINTSKNILLNYLHCRNNSLHVLDVSSNPNLTQLFCGINNFKYLDISKNIELTHLDCYNNELTSLDISHNLKMEWLNCASNKLIEINVSKHKQLNALHCGSNLIPSVDVSNNAKLEYLSCNNNLLTEIDISQNTNLRRINCGGNNIKELDLDNNPKMEDITIYTTFIDQIDLSNKYFLNRIEFSKTPLACLNFGASKSTATEISLVATDVPFLTCIDIGNLKKTQFKWLYLDDGITLQKNCIFSCESASTEEKIINISIYPNPTNGPFTISFNKHVIDELEVSLVNIIGQEIKSYKANNVSEFGIEINQSAGLYFLILKINFSEPIIYKVIRK